LNVKYSECCEMNVIENCEVDNSFSVGLMGWDQTLYLLRWGLPVTSQSFQTMTFARLIYVYFSRIRRQVQSKLVILQIAVASHFFWGNPEKKCILENKCTNGVL
jgi:hypothetical protein